MSFESQMTQGYPPDIDTYLSDKKIEIITEQNPNYYDEQKKRTWGILNSISWAMPLSVYCPSATTFNVRGGKYNFKGEVKTYTPGSAVDPTDNDTIYIWLKPDNTIGSGIDGDGWPTTEHIKLAEIDVDSDGVITAVRDLRGEAFLQHEPAITRLASISVDLNAVAFTGLYTGPTGKKFIIDHVRPRGLSASAGNTVCTFGQTSDKDDFVGAQTLSNLSAAGKTAKIMPVPSATPPATIEYAAETVFGIDVTTAAGSACTAVVEVWGHLVNG